MRTLGLMTLLAFLALQACLAGAAGAEKWEGFRYADKINPPFYQFLRDAVVVIETAGDFGKRVPSEEPDEWVDMNAEGPPLLPAGLHDPRGFQIETCRRAGLMRCPVMRQTTRGTGFILKGNMLVTCRHGFHNWLAWATQANALPPEGMAVPLRIRNSGGDIIYDSARVPPERLLRLTFLNPDLRLNRPVDAGDSYPTPQIAFNARTSDFAEFKSSFQLVPAHAPAMAEADNASAAGGEVYLFGYPNRVKGFLSQPLNGQLAGSHGHVLARMPERGALSASNYTNAGMPGGPMLAPDGAVIAISCGAYGLEQQMTAPHNVNATGIIPDEARLLELWSKLAY